MDHPPTELPRVRTREELLFLLTEAAELEHMLCLQYLFAAFSLKHRTDEGVSEAELMRITEWAQTLYLVARQEMEHMALANNLLTAVGGAPHFRRPNFPQAPKYVPFPMELLPFSETALKRFICYERPTWVSPNDAYCIEAVQPPGGTEPVEGGISSHPLAYQSIAQLYEMIREAFARPIMPEHDLFIGPPAAQVGGDTLHLTFKAKGISGVYDMVIDPVTDRKSALDVIEQIIEEGEGAPPPGQPEVAELLGKVYDLPEKERDAYLREHASSTRVAHAVEKIIEERELSHFKRFERMLASLRELQAANPDFVPARDVVSNPMLYQHPDVGPQDVAYISHPQTRKVMDLFNAAYETLILLLFRFFSHVDETPDELEALNYAAFYPMMTMFIRPLSEVLTTMPAFADDESGKRAGPSFEQFANLSLLPHKPAAWIFIHERLQTMAEDCHELSREPGMPDRLAWLAANLKTTAVKFKHKMNI